MSDSVGSDSVPEVAYASVHVGAVARNSVHTAAVAGMGFPVDKVVDVRDMIAEEDNGIFGAAEVRRRQVCRLMENIRY